MESFSAAQRLFAEAIGTALLVFIGAGSVPAILLLEGGTKAPFSGADLGFISMAFGLIVVALVYTVGKVSGCHINPAVTFGLAVTKRFPWREVPLYWGAQVVGGIAGAFAMWASFGTRAVDLGYGFGVVHFSTPQQRGARRCSSRRWERRSCSSPSWASSTRARLRGWAGLVIGLVIVAIIITVGPITNASLNPARAIGPLFVTTIHGDVHNWTQQFLAYVPGQPDRRRPRVLRL